MKFAITNFGDSVYGVASLAEETDVFGVGKYAVDERKIASIFADSIKKTPVFNTVFDEHGVSPFISNTTACRSVQGKRATSGNAE